MLVFHALLTVLEKRQVKEEEDEDDDVDEDDADDDDDYDASNLKAMTSGMMMMTNPNYSRCRQRLDYF